MSSELASSMLLRPVALEALPRRRRPSLPLLALPFLALIAGAVMAAAWGFVPDVPSVPAIERRLQPDPVAAAPSGPAAAPSLPFTTCLQDPTWTPPSADVQGAHLQADPRYRTVDLTQLAPERVHLELGPYRSASALGDFVALSGLWANPSVQALTCSPDLQGKAELWLLALSVQRVDLHGADLTVQVAPQTTGVAIVQVPLPRQAQALHVEDAGGHKYMPDASLQY